MALQDMSKFGGTGSYFIKEAIDSLFKEGGWMSNTDFSTKLLICTNDGASVNFGHKGGHLQGHVNDGKEWLAKIH